MNICDPLPKNGPGRGVVRKGKQLNPAPRSAVRFRTRKTTRSPNATESRESCNIRPRVTPTAGSSDVQRLNVVEPGLTGQPVQPQELPFIQVHFASGLRMVAIAPLQHHGSADLNNRPDIVKGSDRRRCQFADIPANGSTDGGNSSAVNSHSAIRPALCLSPSANNCCRTSFGRSEHTSICRRISCQLTPLWKPDAPDSAPTSATQPVFPAFLTGLQALWLFQSTKDKLFRILSANFRIHFPINQLCTFVVREFPE